ncbi:MAG TPA: hypothetical protein VEH04_08540 [Verrucomicrobiae bacterium]|nr:hypothetical protein [Verrucomicrobiae bacterium]
MIKLRVNTRGNHAWLKQATLAALLLARGVTAVTAQLSVDCHPAAVFGGRLGNLEITVRNASDRPRRTALFYRLVQTSSSIAAPVGERKAFREVAFLPRQALLESVPISFPDVRAETEFFVQWSDADAQVIGVTRVFVSPTNLLNALGTELPGGLVGVLNVEPMTSVLRAAGLKVIDLDSMHGAAFEGRLVIVGAAASGGDVAARVQSLARSGCAVIWIQAPRERRDKLAPSFYTVAEQLGAVVIVQPSVLENLADDPRSQAHLVQLARIALHPEAPGLPQKFQKTLTD